MAIRDTVERLRRDGLEVVETETGRYRVTGVDLQKFSRSTDIAFTIGLARDGYKMEGVGLGVFDLVPDPNSLFRSKPGMDGSYFKEGFDPKQSKKPAGDVSQVYDYLTHLLKGEEDAARKLRIAQIEADLVARGTDPKTARMIAEYSADVPKEGFKDRDSGALPRDPIRNKPLSEIYSLEGIKNIFPEPVDDEFPTNPDPFFKPDQTGLEQKSSKHFFKLDPDGLEQKSSKHIFDPDQTGLGPKKPTFGSIRSSGFGDGFPKDLTSGRYFVKGRDPRPHIGLINIPDQAQNKEKPKTEDSGTEGAPE